jgi:hypothetical protein
MGFPLPKQRHRFHRPRTDDLFDGPPLHAPSANGRTHLHVHHDAHTARSAWPCRPDSTALARVRWLGT